MRIDLNPGPQPSPETTRSSAKSALPHTSSAASNAPGEDQAQLSGTHAQISALVSQAIQLPEIRQERVHDLQQAIRTGRYATSPEKTAGAVFSHMLDRPA